MPFFSNHVTPGSMWGIAFVGKKIFDLLGGNTLS